MRAKLIRDRQGEAYAAEVTLTERERDILLRGAVPFIYAPGGMGPERPNDSATVLFRGACHTDVESSLLASLDAFRTALAAEMQREDDARDEREGFDAFPSGQFMDAQRGTKGYPAGVRCPFRAPQRAAAWKRGYEAAFDLLTEAA